MAATASALGRAYPLSWTNSLSAAGARLDEIQAQLGHANAATTDRYIARIAPERRIADLQRLWRGER